MPWRMYSAAGTFVFVLSSFSAWSCSTVRYTVVLSFFLATAEVMPARRRWRHS